MYQSPFLRVWANETVGVGNPKSRCKFCRRPITWFTTVVNGKSIALDGHEPVPHRTERDHATSRTIECHERTRVHFGTCPERQNRRPR